MGSNKKMIQKIAIAFIAGVVIFGGLFAYKLGPMYWSDNKGFGGMAAPMVAVDYAVEQTWQPYLKSVGTLSAVNGVDLSSEVDGKVIAIRFKSGQQVDKGDVLVELDDEVEQASLKSEQARLNLARISFNRDEQLIQKKLTSQGQYDKSQAEYAEAIASVEQTKATISKKRISAPFSGKIGIRQINLGQYISAGTAIASLQAVKSLHLDFNLPEQEFPRIYIGQPLTFTVDAYQGQVFEGEVIAINSRVEQSTRNILVRAAVDNQDGRLVPGMFTAVQLTLNEELNVVAVPQTAVTYSLYGETIFTLNELADSAQASAEQFEVHRKSIKTGPVQDGLVAVTEGLVVGERVVIDGQLKLTNGTRVMAVAPEGATDQGAAK